MSNEAVSVATAGQEPVAVAPAQPVAARRAVVAALIGNLLEWYDFAVYGFLALTIAKLFFPADNETASLLASVAAFGVGFLMRPVGAVVLGVLADRRGRKPALTAIIGLMALGTAMIGFAPTYEQAGLWGPAVIVLGRLIQGFSAGGEFGGATAYLVEQAPPGRRALYASLWQLTVAGSLLLGSAVSAAVTGFLSTEDLLSWGWRVPFLIGLLIGPVGLYIRHRAPETLVPAAHDKTNPLRETFRDHWRSTASCFGLVIGTAICTYFFLVNMPTFAVRELHVAQDQALLANAAGLVMCGLFAVLAGHFADRIGPRSIMMASAAFIGLFIVPALQMTLASPSVSTLVLFQLAFGIPVGAMLGVLPYYMATQFPPSSRSTGLSIAYNGATTIFGGFTPFIVAWLVARTGEPFAPAFYVAAAVACSVLALSFAPRHPVSS